VQELELVPPLASDGRAAWEGRAAGARRETARRDAARRAEVKENRGRLSIGAASIRPGCGKSTITPRRSEVQYLLLIYANENEAQAMSGAALGAMMQEYAEFTKSVVQAGQFKAADRLRPVSTASTVRVRNGKVVVTDGPFAETREQLGGYYQIEAKNLDEALAIAARIPSAKYGSIEVRPIWPAEEY
jgi:hypothetical protein